MPDSITNPFLYEAPPAGLFYHGPGLGFSFPDDSPLSALERRLEQERLGPIAPPSRVKGSSISAIHTTTITRPSTPRPTDEVASHQARIIGSILATIDEEVIVATPSRTTTPPLLEPSDGPASERTSFGSIDLPITPQGPPVTLAPTILSRPVSPLCMDDEPLLRSVKCSTASTALVPARPLLTFPTNRGFHQVPAASSVPARSAVHVLSPPMAPFMQPGHGYLPTPGPASANFRQPRQRNRRQSRLAPNTILSAEDQNAYEMRKLAERECEAAMRVQRGPFNGGKMVRPPGL